MASVKSAITIKGTKEGLVFLLDDQCDFVSLLDELHDKLDKHEQQLSGPLMHVAVKLGTRKLNDEDKERLRDAIRKQGNFLIQSIESDKTPEELEAEKNAIKAVSGIIRSGQTIRHDGHLLLLGDVNPGGTVLCTGDIYIMGALRGTAHAGCEGNETSIIAASLMLPTQLRIAEVISRPPEEWASAEPVMEYACLRNGVMEIDKLTHLHHRRSELMPFKGV